MIWRSKKPSDILLDYIEGRGTGIEIDDYVHSNLSDAEEENVVSPVMDISLRYSSKEFPIGISNPESFPEIRELANKLKAKGF